MLISIETYRICDFPGGPGPPYPSGSAHVYDRSTCDIQIFKSTVKPIPKDRFFSCNCSFSIPGASSDTSKHDEVYDSAISHRTTGCFDDRLLTMMTDTGFYVP